MLTSITTPAQSPSPHDRRDNPAMSHPAEHAQMNSIPLKHVPCAVSGLLDEYHRTQRNNKITKSVWRNLTSSDLQVIIQAVDPHSATAYNVSRVSGLFLSQSPDVALSYRWSATFGDIYDGLSLACSPDETVWIDTFFNCQNAALTAVHARWERIVEAASKVSGEMASRGKFSDCLLVHHHLLKTLQSIYGHENRDVAASMSNLGTAYMEQGEFELALTKYEGALAIDRALHGDEHLQVATSLHNIGILHERQGELGLALAKYEESMRIKVQHHGHQEHLDVASSLHKIGIVLRKMGNLKDALAKFEESLQIKRSKLGDEHLDVAETVRYLAVLALDQEDMAEAARRLEEEWRIKCKVLGPEHAEARDLHDWMQKAKDNLSSQPRTT